jgi:DNA-binding NarL/FixJ family response regulator
MLDRAEKVGFATERCTSLTERECEIALLVMSGLRNKAIAGELQLCVGTVKIHLHNIFQKLGVRSRTALRLKDTVEGSGCGPQWPE